MRLIVLLPFLILIQVVDSATDVSSKVEKRTCFFQFDKSLQCIQRLKEDDANCFLYQMKMRDRSAVKFNITCKPLVLGPKHVFRVISLDPLIASAVDPKKLETAMGESVCIKGVTKKRRKAKKKHYDVEHGVRLDACLMDKQVAFSIHPRLMGHANFKISIYKAGYTNQTPEDDWVQVNIPIKVTVVKRRKLKDHVFNYSMLMVAIMNALGLGCMVTRKVITMEAKKPKALLATIIVQLILTPALILVVSWIWNQRAELAYSLLLAGAMPGGGFGYIVVAIMEADVNLSTVANFLNPICSLVTVPFWLMIYPLLQPSLSVAHGADSLAWLEVWLCVVNLPLLLGVALRHYFPKVAENLITWFIRPILLLVMILFVTLGVYINMFVIEACELEKDFWAALMVHVIGLSLGAIIARVLRLDSDATKTVATECASSNCVGAIAVCRFALPLPDAEVVSIMAFWLLFLTPVPFIAAKIILGVKNKVVAFYEKQHRQQMNIAAGLAGIAQIAALNQKDSDDEEVIKVAYQLPAITPANVNSVVLGIEKIKLSDDDSISEKISVL